MIAYYFILAGLLLIGAGFLLPLTLFPALYMGGGSAAVVGVLILLHHYERTTK